MDVFVNVLRYVIEILMNKMRYEIEIEINLLERKSINNMIINLESLKE